MFRYTIDGCGRIIPDRRRRIEEAGVNPARSRHCDRAFECPESQILLIVASSQQLGRISPERMASACRALFLSCPPMTEGQAI
jgi:hypothetical protein